jgi:hypothetical protein
LSEKDVHSRKKEADVALGVTLNQRVKSLGAIAASNLIYLPRRISHVGGDENCGNTINENLVTKH